MCLIVDLRSSLCVQITCWLNFTCFLHFNLQTSSHVVKDEGQRSGWKKTRHHQSSFWYNDCIFFIPNVCLYIEHQRADPSYSHRTRQYQWSIINNNDNKRIIRIISSCPLCPADELLVRGGNKTADSVMTHTHAHTRTYTQTRAHTDTCTHAHTHTHTHTFGAFSFSESISSSRMLLAHFIQTVSLQT